MIEKIASNFSVPFKVGGVRQNDTFMVNNQIGSSLVNQVKSETYQSLINNSVLSNTLFNPFATESFSLSRTLFDGMLQKNGSEQPVDSTTSSASLGSYLSSGNPSQGETLFNSLPSFNGNAAYFYYGAPKPEVYYFVPEKLWNAVVATPGIEQAVQAYDGLPALFELPRWEVETGVGMEPRFRRVEVNESKMLSYDYPQVLTYAVEMMRRDGVGSGEIQVIQALSENISQVLNQPLTLTSRTSEAYYTSRILVLFGVDELFAAYEKSVQDYVKWVKSTKNTEEQMRIFAIPGDLKNDYRDLMAEPANAPALTRVIEDRVRERTTNYTPPQPSLPEKTPVAPRNLEPTVVRTPIETQKNDADVPKEEPEVPGRRVTKSELLNLYGTYDPVKIQRIKERMLGS